VIDYEVQYDEGIGVFVTIATNEPTTSYTVTGLTIGTYYEFRVKSRSEFGQSLTWSDELFLLCASTPTAPTSPFTEAVGANIKITWSEPDS
jgi:hypothetical protein